MIRIQSIRYFLLGFILPLASITTAHADDTEIFYLGDTVTPKVMMILDTSLSMGYHVSNNENRLTLMKKAMRQFINDAEGINVGIMRSNQHTGAIVYPVSSLNTSITETLQRFDRPLTADKDNSYEKANGSVFIDVNEPTNNSHNRVLSFKESSRIGLRFSNITIPQGHTVTKAYLQVIPSASCNTNCGSFSLSIKGEKSANSTQFLAINNNISSRQITTAQVIKNMSGWGDSGRSPPYTINGLQTIVQEIVNQSTWKSGNALSFIFDTSSITNSVLGGISNAASFYGSALFIEVTPFERTISIRDKLLEELDNQRLSSHTPAVPSLYEAVKYMTGSDLESTHNENYNTTRSGYEYNNYFKYFERIAHPNSYINGVVNYPAGCVNGWRNDSHCPLIEINSSNTQNPQYISPLTDTCNNNEGSIIMLTDGEAVHTSGTYSIGQWWNNMTKDISQLINNTNNTCEPKGNPSDGNATTCGTELATKIKNGISVNGLTNPQKIKLYTVGFNVQDSWLQEMATAGGGSYKTATNSADLLTAFKEIQGDIIKDAVTFSNTSITLNSSNQLNHNNNLYYALFTPNEHTSWRGNLKRYKLSSSGNVLGVNGIATDPATGLFVEEAQSFWSATADGAQVTRGGAAERLTSITRNIYTNVDSNLKKLNMTLNKEITPADFLLTTAIKKEEHIQWMLNTKAIADPLHSAPIELSYGEDGSVIYFGDNQGYIHAIDAASGNELWAFIPKELLKNQPTIRINPKTSNHIYGMDGKIVKWTENGRKYIVSGMRRGGNSYYALDVTDRTTPVLKWIISPARSGFSALGQTWSTPIKTKIKKGSDTKNVLIFGGGYDIQQDSVTTRTSDDEGDGLYIVDTSDGSVILQSTDLGYSIPSDIKAIDIDGDGTTDQIYVGDMGGRLIRFDLDGSNSINGDIIANIASTGQINNRRFYHAPDISVLDHSAGSQLAVAIGSGFHAHPNSAAIQDNFYMFKQPVDKPFSTTTITQSNMLPATLTIDNEILANKKGWYLPLNSGGEKVLASSLTFENAVWFTTFKPSIGNNKCIVKRGTSRLYRVNISNGTPNYKEAIPNVVNGKIDVSKSCENTACTITDRYVELHNASIPPSPVLIHVNDPGDATQGSGSVVCIGTYCKELPKRTSKINFWREAP